MKHNRSIYFCFLFAVLWLFVVIVYPETIWSPGEKVLRSSKTWIISCVLGICAVTFTGYLSFKTLERDIILLRGNKKLMEYMTVINQNDVITIKPITGEGKSILSLQVKNAQKPFGQELVLNLYRITEIGMRRQQDPIIISPGLIENKFETEITYPGKWSEGLQLECVSKLQGDVEFLIKIELACSKGQPSLPHEIKVSQLP